jgi:nitrogenase-associated protein
MHLIFYEKPGCVGNARQKAVLLAAGHTLDVRDILTEPLSTETLRFFFRELPFIEWFNPSAPSVTKGEIDPSTLSDKQALEAMLRDRLLIHRPLIRIGETGTAGFSIERLERLGVRCSPGPRLYLFKGDDPDECPGIHTGFKCDEGREFPDMESFKEKDNK